MIDSNLESILAYFEKAIGGLSNTAPIMSEFGLIGTSAVKERIANTKSDPNGKAWRPWKESTELHRIHKGNAALGLLFDTGNLMRSISAKQGPGTVEIGSSAEYADFLQDGTKNMKARPFLGWSDPDQDHISAAFNAWVDRSIQ